MLDLLRHCRWPDLPPPYGPALQEAVSYILEQFDVLGIIAAGSIIRGTPHRSSDFDIYVINAQQQRQRIQKFFQKVPAEIFVNPVSTTEGYFQDELKRGRPGTAHMFVTGFVVLDRDPAVAQLRRQAKTFLASPPNPSEAHLTFLRYGIVDQYENACDIMATNPAGASMILSLSVFGMLQYVFWKINRYLPRDKDLLDTIADLDPPLANLVQDFYRSVDINKRQMIAAKIADRTIETKEFFEWQSPLEDVAAVRDGLET